VGAAWSIAEAKNCAAPGGVRSTTRFADRLALTSSSPHSRCEATLAGDGVRDHRAAVAALTWDGVDESGALRTLTASSSTRSATAWPG
jgi:hypothetical protein